MKLLSYLNAIQASTPMGAAFVRKWPWLLTILGVVVSLLLHQWTSERRLLVQQTFFDKRFDVVVSALKRRLDSNAQVLRGVSGLFTGSAHVSRGEFQSYYKSLKIEKLHPGIQGVGFAQWIAPSDLSAHTQGVRSEGFPNYSVRPDTAREQYSSILYLEPFDWRNQRAFGFDMFSEASRQRAMRRAVDFNEPALSDKVTLVQETDTAIQAGFLIYNPIFKKNMPISNAAERWRALFGWSYSPLRAKDLVDSFLATEFKDLEAGVNWRIFSSTVQDWGEVLYQSPFEDLPEPQLRMASKTINIYGVNWLVVATPQKGYWKDLDHYRNDRIVLILSIGLSFLIGFLLSTLTHRNQRLLKALAQTVSINQTLEEKEISLRLAGVVMRVSPTGIFVADSIRRIIAVNPSFTAITGFSDVQVLGQQVDFLISRHAVVDDVSSIWVDIDQNGIWQGELSFRRPDGSLYPNDVSITLVDYGHGQGSQYVGMFTDISARRKDEERIRFLAHHDYLTGLPNRALFVDRAEQVLLGAMRYNHKPVLIFIDLDRFKPINDEHGHDVGDAVLKAIAQRLLDHVRQSDFVCRQGGDEFVIMLPDHAEGDDLMALAKLLLKTIEKPFTVGTRTLSLSASIGVATYPDHGDTVDALIQSADTAMYQAKADKQHHIKMASSS